MTTSTQPPTFVTPVGAILAYAGSVSSPGTLAASGWLCCDGTLYSTTDYAALYGALQASNGASGANQFAVPDYRAVFLRGVDGGSGNDADAAKRVAPRSSLAVSGATGDNPGSYQADAPRSHTHTFSASSNPYGVMAELTNDLAAHNQWGQTTASSGGDETRPVNTYVNFLVCWTSSSNGVANPSGGTAKLAVPVGTLLPYSGQINTSALAGAGWQLCDGTSLDTTASAALFAAIGYSFGGSGSQFNLPDLRGCFLRGVDGGRGLDPDASTRTAPASGGSTGDAPGSFQGSLLASHTHSYYDWDHSNYHKSGGGLAGTCTTTDLSSESTSSTGGSETRPPNMNVYWLIKVQ